MAGDGNKLGLGVDTGGTYTDAAVVDLHTRKVVSRAKSPTTYNDLSIGLRGAIDGALEGEFDLDDIRLVGVSTTLATNSVLEGKGGKVGMIGIGFKPKEDWFLGEDRSAFISGGHNVSGGRRARWTWTRSPRPWTMYRPAWTPWWSLPSSASTTRVTRTGLRG
ncbi:MAG: hydantoinase/oxoprolinase N-terminal domain-containing protein [Thermoplasmatota archaeon]